MLATASVAVALAAADTYVVVLALTDMMTGVGLGIDALQKATPIISGFLLGYIAVLPLIGRLADLVARQRILVACLMIFVVGSAITALAVELPVLVTGRVLQGIGGGGLVPATLAIVADLWPAERRGTPLGVVGAVQEVGSVLGPVFGAAVLAVSDWRMIFWLNVVAGLALAAVAVAVGGQPLRRPRGIPLALGALALFVGGLALAAPARLATDVTLGVPFVPFGDSTSRVLTPIGLVALALVVALVVVTAPRWWGLLRRADLPGAVLLGLALGSVVLTFAASDPEREVLGPLGFALLPVGAVALGLYLWRHRTTAEPLVARGVVRGRARTALVVSLMVGAALVAVIVNVPVLARLTLTDSQTVAAFVLVRFLLAVPVGALLGGWSLRRCGDGLVSGVGLLVATAGLLVMSGWEDGSLDGPMATVVLVLVGLGIGLALAPVNNAALADAPADAHGVASALVVVARMVGMVVGLALLTAIGLHRYYETVAALPDQTDTKALLAAGIVQVQTVFLGAAVAALLGAVASLGLGLRRRPADDHGAPSGSPLSTVRLG
ncbi:MFS transporter [Phycicoccus sp. Soil803]|uniref:MFS transporter n=1 Tax=Phycicoccus sp. Soil803 TaxID=1736415 RepID=UPI001F44E936|nr:MFS transporter [Phycicoccus sp. Soil803]